MSTSSLRVSWEFSPKDNKGQVTGKYADVTASQLYVLSPRARASRVRVVSSFVRWFFAEYTLHYSFEEGHWLKVTLDAANAQTYVLQGLRCGTVYQLYMTASNSLGTGEPGPRAVARTKGS